MARPSYPKSTVWEKGPKKNYYQFIPSFPPPSNSNPKTQHRSQIALPSHISSPLDILLSQPIEFVKTQTTSKPFTGDQTISSFGYFNNKKMKRKGNLILSKDKVIRMRRDATAKNGDRPDLSGNKPLDQSQPPRERGVAGEGSIGKATHKIPAKKIRQPSSEKFGIPQKEKQNKPDEELAKAAPIKPKTSYRIGTKLSPAPPKEGKERNGLPKVPHLPKSGVHSGSYPVSTTPPPNRTTPLNVSERMAILELDSTTKNQSKNLKPNPDTIVSTPGKIVVSGKSDLKRKPEALSEQPPKRRHNELRVKGLTNDSFFCYRNSVLQLLASSSIFVKEMIKHKEEKCHCGPDCASCALRQFFQNHFRPAGGEQALNPSLPAVDRLRDVLPVPFGHNQCSQEDASEYMLALLNKGVDQLNSIQRHTNLEENHFDRVFGAKYDSVLTCPICNNRSVTPEYQLSLQLAPKVTPNGLINLKACFASNFAEEYVEASCEKCGYKTEPSEKSKRFAKKTEIRKLPKFLVINLSRYKIGKFAQTKIMNPVKLEEKLVLKEGDKDVIYQLRGVISHRGRQVKSGHYIAFTKQPDRTWAKCDDMWVTESNLEHIRLQQNVFQIYVLGYQQVTC